MADIVRVVNKGDKPLRLAFNSQITVIPAKGEGFLDREAAITHFGNPAVRNDPGSKYVEDQQARKLEFERVKALYVSLGDGADRQDLSSLPSVEIYDVTGEKWTTLLEDPEGQELSVIGAPEQDKEQVLQALQEQIERMQEQLNSERAQPVAVGEDVPRPPRQRKPAVVMPSADEE